MYQMRILSIALLFCAVIFGVGSALLIPSLIAADGLSRSAEEQLNAFEESGRSVSEAEGKNLELLERKIRLLQTYSPTYPKTYFDAVLSHTGPGITMVRFEYKIEEEYPAIIISGNALTRDHLLTFVEKMEGDERFRNVDLPVRFLANDSDISFTVTLEPVIDSEQ